MLNQFRIIFAVKINLCNVILSQLKAIDTKKLGDRMKAGIENLVTEAESGLGLKTNKPYKGRAPVFTIDEDSGRSI